jgi:glycyl-tRNA synthetase alpha subunit
MLVRIDEVKEGEAISVEKRTGYMQKLRQLTGEEISRAYLSDARQNASIKVNLPEAVKVQP